MSEAKPSNLELMQYADGELEPARASQIDKWLAGDAQGRAAVATIQHLGALVCHHADLQAQQAGADGIVDAVMDKLQAEPPPNVVPLQRTRSVKRTVQYVGMGVGVLAAAAALVLAVGRVLPEPKPITATAPSFSVPPPERLLVAEASRVDREVQPAVLVDAVDFGSLTGTVFYVPTDQGSTTTVVWLSDDESGGR